MKNQINFNIWQGVLKTFPKTYDIGEVYESETWKQTNLKRAQEFVDELGNIKKKCSSSFQYPLISTIIAEIKSSKVNILDVGGGSGTIALQCISKLPEFKKYLNFYILDNPTLTNYFSSNLKLPSQIKFINKFEEVDNKIDILHFGSVVQYFENQKLEIQKIISLMDPKWIVISDAMIGNIESFVTMQNYYGKEIPFWFTNQNEFNEIMYQMKYTLVLEEDYRHEKTHIYFPQANLPKENQISNSKNMIYLRND